MTDQSSQFPKFYVTTPSPCPYIEGNVERKIFAELVTEPLAYDKEAIFNHFTPSSSNKHAEDLHSSLALVGFRRSQEIVYRPACETCQECKSSRVPAILFTPSKGQKRILNKNKDITFEVKTNIATKEQYDLLKNYIIKRHETGGMVDMSFEDYKDMVETSPIKTIIIEYRLPDRTLVAVALTDQMHSSLSMVYSYFDVSEETSKRSLGVFMVLNHIEIAKSRGLDYVYLGYFVKNSAKMNYKMKFKPLEVLGTNGWCFNK